MRLVFDIETNGFLDVVHTIHCIAAKDLDTGTCYDWTDHNYPSKTGTILEGLGFLSTANALYGHNIQAFDIPAIKKVVPTWRWAGKIRDTIIMSRLQHVHDMMQHSLEAWGKRLKCPKGDFGKHEFGKQNGWEKWSPAMHKYCIQDVEVNYKVAHFLEKNPFPESAIELEHEFAYELELMMNTGAPFDTDSASRLGLYLEAEEARKKLELTTGIEPFEDRSIFIPKANNATRGYIRGVPFTKVKRTPFNPGSRNQVVRFFKEKYGWRPTVFTDKGNPKVNAEVLNELPYPEAKPMAEYFDTKKLLGQCSTGKAAWLKLCEGGRIHGYINHNGAVTGRCTHSSPNLGQVPTPRSYKGKECRSLFKASVGNRIVGCDASGLELRNLAHYMFRYDGGKYAEVILNGDIHTENQQAAGLPTRDSAKTFIYAHNYGAGDAKLGSIVRADATEALQKAEGRKLRSDFMAKLPALANLVRAVKATAKARGYIIGLDGRRLYVHSDHVALNVLLQGAGSVFMKKATVIACKEIRRRMLDAKLILHVHDEFQFEVADGDVEEVKPILEKAMELAGEFFNYNIKMEGVAVDGANWYETH